MRITIFSFMQTYIETSRLILRDWKEEDIPLFALMNADPHVMEYFLQPLTPEESLNFYHRIQKEFQTCGFGLYAVERKEDHAFMGYTGLHQITFDVDFAPGIEIGWHMSIGDMAMPLKQQQLVWNILVNNRTLQNCIHLLPCRISVRNV